MTAFLDWYSGLWADGAGNSDAEVNATESRLGARMPSLLRDVYLGTSRRSSEMMHLKALDEVHVRDGVLAFAHEQQGCYHWGLRVVDSVARPEHVFVQDGDRWTDDGCSLEEFLRFLALTNRPYEEPSVEVDFDPDRLRPPWQLHRVQWRSIQHELWTNGEAVLEEATSMLGARDATALRRAADSLGVDPDELDEVE